MAKRYQVRGLFRSHDARQTCRVERVSLGDLPFADGRQRFRTDRYPAACDRYAVGDRLVAHVDHLHAPPFVDVTERLRALAMSLVRRHYTVSARTLSSRPARKNERLSSETVKSTLFSFTVSGTRSAPGEKIQHCADSRFHHGVHHLLR